MDAPSIITQVTSPKEEESCPAPGGGPDKASQSSINLKKQRSRSIFSSLFCCFRNYNVDTTAIHSTTVLPPVVEENGGFQKGDQRQVIPIPSGQEVQPVQERKPDSGPEGPPAPPQLQSPLPLQSRACPLISEGGPQEDIKEATLTRQPSAKYLLPEVKVPDYGKKCMVIDLDETLVHSSFKGRSRRFQRVETSSFASLPLPQAPRTEVLRRGRLCGALHVSRLFLHGQRSQELGMG
ncbi:CTD small phosphatase-like protein isoform X4 [Macrotis lagotis]|uniref:CTD small phosphatase-like protein isoform X4 n=1 Tax=Macrotis lagotis TaxID=92651 RepID=UPI003D69652C